VNVLAQFVQLHCVALVGAANAGVHGNDHHTISALNQGEVNAEQREKSESELWINR